VGGPGGCKKFKAVTIAQCNTQNFTDTSNLLDNTILGWSVEGVRRGSPRTGP